MKKADLTRINILQHGFDLIYRHGYQATSIDDILATTQVTKGAFYYHFKNKDEMGVAIINEILKPGFASSFNHTDENDADPLVAIYEMIHYLLIESKFMKAAQGCPASNLTQEMTPWHSEFKKALEELTDNWEKKMIALLEKGKKQGYVRKSVNSRQVTLFILSGYWGIRNFGKLENSKKRYLPYLKELKNYLATLQ